MVDEELYKKLIERVRQVNQEAAEYMEIEARKLEGFRPSSRLTGAFIWAITPQGWPYWEDIRSKIAQSEDL